MTVFNLGMGEITVILVLALIFLGPKKLPELASGLGKLIREIRKTTSDVKNEIQLDEAIRKPFEELRDAVTLHPEELKRRDRLRKELADIQRRAAESVASADAEHAAGDSVAANTGGAALDVTSGENPALNQLGAESSSDQSATASVSTEPAPLPPAVTGAAPVGTVAREPSVPAHSPPSPPLAAVLAKAPGPPTPERRVLAPPTGSDFLRSARSVHDNKKAAPDHPPAGPLGAADRSNITQQLTEADLAAITVTPAPPPPPTGKTSDRTEPQQPDRPRLPGATPPKNPNR
jgi:sec-independent protein translocase protein TatB